MRVVESAPKFELGIFLIEFNNKTIHSMNFFDFRLRTRRASLSPPLSLSLLPRARRARRRLIRTISGD